MTPPRIRVAVNLAMARADALVALTQRAEACGYESAWLSEHVALNSDGADVVARYGRLLYRPDTDLVAPLVALAAMAQATSTIRLGVSVLLAPLRHPVLLAREIATLDVLAAGRAELGLGVGWNANEYRAAGAEYSNRGERMDELLDAMHELFRSERPEHHGRHYDFGPIGFRPKPLRPTGPALLIGGNSDAARRRAVRRGDGWLASGSIERVVEMAPQLRRERAVLGREAPFQIMVTMLDRLPGRSELDALGDAGIDRLLISPWQDDGEPRLGTIGVDEAGELDRYAARIGLPRLDDAKGAP